MIHSGAVRFHVDHVNGRLTHNLLNWFPGSCNPSKSFYIWPVSWRRTLPSPIGDKHGNAIRTLDDARAYMLALDENSPGVTQRIHWQAAAGALLSAVKDRDVAQARHRLTFALLMDGLLDLGTA